MNEINCVIEQTNGFLRCYGPKFKRREYFIEENAPHNIIGLYSGEEDRLWTSFYETYYKSYIKRIKTNRHQERIFTTLEKSRNVIMHSGELGERDIERIGINIRDWISQVGA